MGVVLVPCSSATSPRLRSQRGLQGTEAAHLLLLLLVRLGQHGPVLLLVKGQRHAMLSGRIHLAGGWGQQGA